VLIFDNTFSVSTAKKLFFSVSIKSEFNQFPTENEIKVLAEGSFLANIVGL
jgi:hypothetical protein